MEGKLLEQLLGPYGLVVFLLFVLFSGWRGWWVWGRAFDELKREKNEWKSAALRSLGAAEKLTSFHSSDRRREDE